MLGFKGFHRDWKCMNCKKYEIGKIYTEKYARMCQQGIHFCRFPLDVFNYYRPGMSKYALIETDEKDMDNNKGAFYISYDTKECTKKLKILKELSIKEMIEKTIEMIKEGYENNFSYLRVFYKITKDSIKINDKSKIKKMFVAAISKLEDGLSFNDFKSSVSLSTENRGISITTGDNSISVSRNNSISAGENSISVTYGDKEWRTNSYTISTGNKSMSISNDNKDCITFGDYSICSNISTITSMKTRDISYGKNSIIASIGNNMTNRTYGDNSTIVSYGTNSNNILLEGKNSVSVFFGNENYNPGYSKGVYFVGKLGSIFIFPIYKLVGDPNEFKYEISDFMMRKVDNKDLIEDVVYEYVNNKIIKTPYDKNAI